MEDRPTRVLLADDHAMFRRGLAGLLASHGGLEVVGETANDAGAVDLARRTKPDVVVMEARMPLEEAKEALGEMRAIVPAPKVIIVTVLEDPGVMRELLRLGAGGYVPKSASSARLVGAIRAAALGAEDGGAVAGAPGAVPEGARGGSGGVLSARELEILLLAARGLSNRRIAGRVHLAEGTVKRHLSNAYGKMGVGSRSEAARKALAEDWITVREITEDDRRGA